METEIVQYCAQDVAICRNYGRSTAQNFIMQERLLAGDDEKGDGGTDQALAECELRSTGGE